VNSPVILHYKDVTIKARIADSLHIEKLLRLIGAEFIGTDLQIDHYFDTDKGKLKWREAALENLITHYERIVEAGIERTIVYRYDLNPNKEQISELYQNHEQFGITKKLRKIYQFNNVKIHLDKLPNEEEFIEIEAIDREDRLSVDELRSLCLEMKVKLTIPDSDLIPTGYLRGK